MIALNLVSKRGLLGKVFGHIKHLFTDAAAINAGDDCASMSHDAISRVQYSRPATDLEYLLRHNKVASHVLTPSCGGVSPAPWDTLLDVMRLLQMVDTCTRQITSHVLFESSTWKRAFQANPPPTAPSTIAHSAAPAPSTPHASSLSTRLGPAHRPDPACFESLSCPSTDLISRFHARPLTLIRVF